MSSCCPSQNARSSKLVSCADQESFLRGSPTLTTFVFFFFFFFFFKFDGGRKDLNTTISGPSKARRRNVISMAFRWRVDVGPTLNAGLVAL